MAWLREQWETLPSHYSAKAMEALEGQFERLAGLREHAKRGQFKAQDIVNIKNGIKDLPSQREFLPHFKLDCCAIPGVCSSLLQLSIPVQSDLAVLVSQLLQLTTPLSVALVQGGGARLARAGLHSPRGLQPAQVLPGQPSPGCPPPMPVWGKCGSSYARRGMSGCAARPGMAWQARVAWRRRAA